MCHIEEHRGFTAIQPRPPELLFTRLERAKHFANDTMPISATQLESPAALHRTAPPVHPSDLISQLLREQSTLTAVEEFSAWHRTHSEPEQAMYYRSLIPETKPQPGQQLAFEVDLDKCSGCKACVVACHTLNGLDEGESFRDVGLLLGSATGSTEAACGTSFQHVTTACHHCVDPGCLNACPVNAYEKDPVTGIVRHLDDQCFGCQYCTLACPYEVPKFHAAKGIVRKCDMCSQRLGVGEAPACVQACPHHAISIKIIEIAAAKADAIEGRFLADSPDSNITIPTTRFVGKSLANPSMRAGTYAAGPLEHAHWPLILLLVLSQIAVGIVCVLFAGQISPIQTPFSAWQLGEGGRRPDAGAGTILLAIASILAALSALSSTLHLGRPQFAYRAILGIRHSWLSREIAAFGVFIPLCFLSATLSWFDSAWLTISLAATAVSGVAGVAASVMVYHVTRRPFWNASRSAPSFMSGSIGIGALFVLLGWHFSAFDVLPFGCQLLAGTSTVMAFMKLWLLRASLHKRNGTSRLLAPALADYVRMQTVLSCTFFSMCAILTLWPTGVHVGLFAGIGLVAGMVAEFIDRYLFFRAVVPLQMPGVVKS